MKNINKYFFTFIFFGFDYCTFSQTNLVPNPSFEDSVKCPNSTGQLNFSKFWINPTLSSPDYFNSCNTGVYGVPSNFGGFEPAHTGKAYVGIVCFGIAPFLSNSIREYIQAPLDSALLPGELYCVEFYVSLTDGIYTDYAVNTIGAYFSTNAVSSANYDPLPYTPQVVNTSFNPLTKYNGWTKISGQFIATGGERYITIGNFNDNTNADTIRMFYNNIPSKNAYYYIDDVSVIHLDAGAGTAKAACNGVGAQIGRSVQPGISYSWQPAAGLSDTAIAQPIATPTVTTTYYLTATLTRTGCAKTDSVTVFYMPTGPTAILNISDSTLCKGEKGSAIAVINSTASPYTYSWSGGVPGSGFRVSGLEAGNYTVTVTDALGCTATATTTITNKPPCECGEDMYIANVFSPNNDGKNDVLNIEGNGLTNIYWGIYDRWGNLVFEAYDQTHPWDGTLKGSPVEAGVYSYYLRGTCVKTHGVVTLKGNVSIVK